MAGKAVVLALATGIFSLAGCGVPSLPTIQAESVDATELVGKPGGIPAAAPGPVTMTRAQWAAPADRLPADIPRAVKRNEWAVLHIEPAVNDTELRPSHGGAVMSVTGLLPDDREATILAWRISADEVGVAVRVGYFGDPAAERQFLAVLREVMAGKPKPKRGGTFELP